MFTLYENHSITLQPVKIKKTPTTLSSRNWERVAEVTCSKRGIHTLVQAYKVMFKYGNTERTEKRNRVVGLWTG